MQRYTSKYRNDWGPEVQALMATETGQAMSRPVLPAREVAADLADTFGGLHNQLVALNEFGAESVAGPLLSSLGVIEPIVRTAASQLRGYDTLFDEFDKKCQALAQARDSLDEARRLTEAMSQRWSDFQGVKSALDHSQRLVTAIRKQLAVEVREGRLSKGGPSRIYSAAYTAVNQGEPDAG